LDSGEQSEISQVGRQLTFIREIDTVNKILSLLQDCYRSICIKLGGMFLGSRYDFLAQQMRQPFGNRSEH
jgi:hypothetical protein